MRLSSDDVHMQFDRNCHHGWKICLHTLQSQNSLRIYPITLFYQQAQFVLLIAVPLTE